MSTRTNNSKVNRPQSKSDRERQLIEAIEAYVRRRGDYLEAACQLAQREDDKAFGLAVAVSQSALGQSEAAIVPLLEGRLPVIWNGYLYVVDGQALRSHEVQVLG